ncbi:protein kinase [Herbidospora galbida]|uniref:non-specific serine/threonine protein kinase n=1 Tax=Herbidospora galbida TaxID=2575442 RepID=A0A4U3MPM8_9ACTN|nr:serine/threonine-protein kinase [Herbidospora galbida]TKK90799.1 protein kinase [Herbidospora galbida]
MSTVDDAWAVTVPTGYRVGEWEVTRPIASGSWASVYEGRRSCGRVSALKFLPTGTVTRRQVRHLRDMAQREIRAHDRLRHDRLIGLHEIITVDDAERPELDGACVLVTERAERSLADLVTQGVPVRRTPRILAEVCEGLAHMHSEKWVHGDLKPSNILLMADGSVRLADFGLSAELQGTHGYLPPIGSMDHLPPERWGEPLTVKGNAVRTSADIWALGVTACQLFTGRYPFAAPTARGRYVAAAEYAAGHRGLDLPASIPEGWRAWIAACLARDVRARPTAFELLHRARVLNGAPDPTTPLPRRVARSIVAGLLVVGCTAASTVQDVYHDPFARWLNPAATDIPDQYKGLIVEAGTMCDEPGLSPALVAGMLKVESGFDPGLSDPAGNEYGIARWTPAVLQYYLPNDRRGTVPSLPLTVEDSIPAVGRYLCVRLPLMSSVPGDPGLLGAAAFRSSDDVIRRENGVPERIRAHVEKVRAARDRYLPTSAVE